MRLLDRPLPTLSRAPASWKSGVSEFVYPTQSRITDEFQGGHTLRHHHDSTSIEEEYI
jgi:hypothetical protein